MTQSLPGAPVGNEPAQEGPAVASVGPFVSFTFFQSFFFGF